MQNHAKILIDSVLTSASHAIRVNISQVTGYSPGALAFHRDMLLDVPLVIDLPRIRDKRYMMVDENLHRINAKRSPHDDQSGHKILKKKHEWTKLGERWDGPFEIKKKYM